MPEDNPQTEGASAQSKAVGQENWNGVLRLYNQFPRRYPGGLPQMIEDLPRIVEMGFNAVWMNPVQATGQIPVNRAQFKGLKGSLYAMSSPDDFNPDFFPERSTVEDYEKCIKNYTKTARDFGLIPMFDLVLGQVAKDSSLVKSFGLKPGEANKQKDQARRANDQILEKPNGMLKLRVSPNGQELWDDTFSFDYSSEETQNYLMRNLWEPFIVRYLSNYGFGGVRIDAVKKLPKTFLEKVNTFIIQESKKSGQKPLIIFGELLDNKPMKYIEKLSHRNITHILCSQPYHTNFRNYKNDSNGEQALRHISGSLQAIVYKGYEGFGIGGTLGYSGNHDEMCLIDKVRQEMGYDRNEKAPAFRRYLIEKLVRVACSCSGGWYLLAGDEYGADFGPTPHSPIVFDEYKQFSLWINRDRENPKNMEWIIIKMNQFLSHLPPSGAMEWVEQLVISKEPFNAPFDIPVIVRHCGEGYASPAFLFVCPIKLPEDEWSFDDIEKSRDDFIKHYTHENKVGNNYECYYLDYRQNVLVKKSLGSEPTTAWEMVDEVFISANGASQLPSSAPRPTASEAP